jgi:3-oxoacyl-[acyl-carrier protein] reductase
LKLNGKAAIITGGSRGIGKAIATAFLDEGAKIAIAARTAAEIDSTIEELKNGSKNSVIGVRTDVSSIDDVKNLATQTESAFGKIDILVNAAGVQQPIGPFIETDAHEWIRNININLIGTMLCCKYALPSMISQGRGKIINFSGGGATGPRPYFSAYACSKTAIVRFTEITAIELKDKGIDVNAIAPGAINTNMIKEILEAGEKASGKELAEAKMIMEKGGASPAVAAGLAVFLASGDSDGLTGRLISALWDEWRNYKDCIAEICCSSLCTLRRIDGKNFVEKKNEL